MVVLVNYVRVIYGIYTLTFYKVKRGERHICDAYVIA
jgi:hypothetical protein